MNKTETIFTEIYRQKGACWGGSESKSGSGSDLFQTKAIRHELPLLFKKLNLTSILDIPCGDYYWMNTLCLDGISYIGDDIVMTLISDNRRKYSKPGRQFLHLDLIEDMLPSVDLILCRDCFVHLSFEDVFKCLKNIYLSKSTYLLSTTFVETELNSDIETGGWRKINLCQSPFHLPPPDYLILEQCTEKNDQYKDKALGLWRIDKF